ncbi:alpha/beta hydrolase [Streptomyces sp. NBC_01310]|uniref:alpha/beta fold hydrolase n=1 Tax=Streptomyces sp. NBC_01310 TaxID=2903820 RepID=UPI0035B68FDE|nr:alpha/beta hydrolase [Streptomyces sp. NBC_01310]
MACHSIVCVRGPPRQASCKHPTPRPPEPPIQRPLLGPAPRPPAPLRAGPLRAGPLIHHLPVPRVHLLGHSHGGFVAQYHAMHRPEQIAGVVLYESAPGTGPELGAETARNVEAFAARHADRPQVRAVMEAFAAIPAIADDEAMLAAAKGIVPAYVADYWSDTARWNRLQDRLRATYRSGLDERGVPDLFDGRAAGARVGGGPATTWCAGCGVRWAEELHKLLHGSRLLVLEHSGHFGHVEEPESFAREVAAFVLADNG